MKETETYLDASQSLISKFYEIYYNENEPPAPSDWQHDIHMIWIEHGPWIIWIWDDFRGMEDLYVALKYEAKEEDLFKWYYYRIEEKWTINLYNWLKWSRVYTKEEIKESEEKVRQAKKILENETNRK